MLILTRFIGQSFMIDDDIQIMITKRNGNNIGIGIEAPLHRIILRDELYYRLNRKEEKSCLVQSR